jgi:hypothetical protein
LFLLHQRPKPLVDWKQQCNAFGKGLCTNGCQRHGWSSFEPENPKIFQTAEVLATYLGIRRFLCKPPSPNQQPPSEEISVWPEPSARFRGIDHPVRCCPSNSEEFAGQVISVLLLRRTAQQILRDPSYLERTTLIVALHRRKNGCFPAVERCPEGHLSLAVRHGLLTPSLFRLPPSPRKSVKPKQLSLRAIVPKNNRLPCLTERRIKHRLLFTRSPKEAVDSKSVSLLCRTW